MKLPEAVGGRDFPPPATEGTFGQRSISHLKSRVDVAFAETVKES